MPMTVRCTARRRCRASVAAVDTANDEDARDGAFLSQVVDPGARRILEASDPWQAYRVANDTYPALLDHDLPHSGALYVAWAELTDLFETGKTPVPDAHAALRRAAAEWLRRPGPATATHAERWIKYASDQVRYLSDRDGDFWRGPRA